MNPQTQGTRRLWPCLLVIALAVAAIGCRRAGQQIEYRCPMHPEVVSLVGRLPGLWDETRRRRPRRRDERRGQHPPGPLRLPYGSEVTSNEPDTCPKCGMELVLANTQEARARAVRLPAWQPVTVPAAKRQMLG